MLYQNPSPSPKPDPDLYPKPTRRACCGCKLYCPPALDSLTFALHVLFAGSDSQGACRPCAWLQLCSLTDFPRH